MVLVSLLIMHTYLSEFRKCKRQCHKETSNLKEDRGSTASLNAYESYALAKGQFWKVTVIRSDIPEPSVDAHMTGS